ncbi:MAG: transposase, partial [Candidatus Brocadia sp.]
MAKDYKEISLIKFQEKFQTEEGCQKRLIELRWPDGFVCPHCGGRDYYEL